jgi:hypothetical protein
MANGPCRFTNSSALSVGGKNGFVFSKNLSLVLKEEERVGKRARAILATKSLGDVRKALYLFCSVFLPESNAALVMLAFRIWAKGRRKGRFSVQLPFDRGFVVHWSTSEQKLGVGFSR